MKHEELVERLLDFLSDFSGVQAYGLILAVLFLCGIGLPMPEDITLISAGILASLENISLPGAMIVGFIGVLIGDTILYSIGRKFGRKVFTWPFANRLFTPARVERAEQMVQKNGRKICFTARFLPGLRAPIYLTSGVLGVSFSNFFLLDGLAALLSVPLWIVAGYYFGENLDAAVRFAKQMNVLIIGAILVLIVFWFIRHRKSSAPKSTPSQ